MEGMKLMCSMEYKVGLFVFAVSCVFVQHGTMHRAHIPWQVAILYTWCVCVCGEYQKPWYIRERNIINIRVPFFNKAYNNRKERACTTCGVRRSGSWFLLRAKLYGKHKQKHIYLKRMYIWYFILWYKQAWREGGTGRFLPSPGSAILKGARIFYKQTI